MIFSDEKHVSEKRLWFHVTEKVVDCLVGEPLEGSLS